MARWFLSCHSILPVSFTTGDEDWLLNVHRPTAYSKPHFSPAYTLNKCHFTVSSTRKSRASKIDPVPGKTP